MQSIQHQIKSPKDNTIIYCVSSTGGGSGGGGFFHTVLSVSMNGMLPSYRVSWRDGYFVSDMAHMYANVCEQICWFCHFTVIKTSWPAARSRSSLAPLSSHASSRAGKSSSVILLNSSQIKCVRMAMARIAPAATHTLTHQRDTHNTRSCNSLLNDITAWWIGWLLELMARRI